MSNHTPRSANEGANRGVTNLQISVRLQIELSDLNGDDEAGLSSFDEEEEDEEEDIDSEDEIAPEVDHPIALLQENVFLGVNEALVGNPREQPPGVSADYDEEANNPMDPAMAKFIDEMEYAQVFLGRVKIPKKTHHKVKIQGPMNAREKHLIQFINTALQYPPVIGRCTRFSQQTMRNYSFSIKRYVLFMANKGFTKDNFEVNGVRMVECMKKYEELNLMEDGTAVPPAHGVIQNFKFGMQALQFCLGFYHTRKITDGNLRLRKRQENWDEILNFDVIDQYSKESKRRRYIVAKENNYDKTRPEMDKSGYLDDQLKEMMVAMYEKTKSSKQNVIYDSINTILEFLLGHHLLFRSRNKRNLEVSDSVFTIEDTAQGKIPVLGFKFTEGKTLDANTPPQQMGACRNKDVELCLVTAFALSLWYRLDFKDEYGLLTRDRFPDFMSKEKWYPIKVLWTKSAKSMNENQAISYNYEALLVRQCLKVVRLQSLKKTHLGRVVSARKADARNIEECQIRRAGKWRTDSVQNSYLSPYPFDFLHHSGGFAETERYFLPRAIDVPEELQKMIFPWLEDEMAKLEERGDQRHLSIVERDRTALKFLQMLKEFRSVIIQDLAVLVDLAPNSIFSKHEITGKAQFIMFKARVEERTRNLSVFDGIRDQPNVVDVICPAFLLKLEVIKSGVDMSNCEVTEKLKSLEVTIQNQQGISAERESKANALARAMMNDQITMVIGNQMMALETQYRQMRESVARTEETIMMLFDRLSLVNANNEVRAPAASTVENEDQSLPPAAAPTTEGSSRTRVVTEQERKNRLKVANFSRTYPGWQLRKSTVTIPQLIIEWYVPRGNVPVVEQRNALAGTKWRDSASFYKRRKAVIDFVESMTKDESYNNITRDEAAKLLQSYMVGKNWLINGLGTRLLDVNSSGGKIPEKRIISDAVKSLWLANQA